MASNYARGRSFEYRIRDFLIQQDYDVERSLMSRGPYDLRAVSKQKRTHNPMGERMTPDEVRLVQCKKTKGGYITKKERDGLIAAVAREKLANPGAIVRAEVAYLGKPSGLDRRLVPIRFKEVTA